MRNIKVNGKKVSMPDGWHDVKFSDGFKIVKDQLNEVQTFALLSGMSVKKVRGLNKNEDIFYFVQGYPFLYSNPFNDTPSMPQSIKYKGDRIHFPFVMDSDPLDLGDCSVGQVEDMKALIATKIKEIGNEEDEELSNIDVLSIIPFIVSIYIQPFIDGEYDYKKAMLLVDDLKKNLSYKDMIHIGNFFLKRLQGLTNGLMKGWKKPHQMKRLFLLVLKKLQKLLGFM